MAFFENECFVVCPKKSFQDSNLPRGPGLPSRCCERRTDQFYPGCKKSLYCFFPVKSASQIPRQRSKHLVLLYNHLSPNQLFPTKGKQKIGQYFVASPDLFRHWTIFCLRGANSAASHKFKLPSKICQKSFLLVPYISFLPILYIVHLGNRFWKVVTLSDVANMRSIPICKLSNFVLSHREQ